MPRLQRKNATDPLIREIQQLRKHMDLEEKEFTEEEKTGPDAVRERTDERDDLKNTCGLFDQIAKLRKELNMQPREYEEVELTGERLEFCPSQCIWFARHVPSSPLATSVTLR